MLYAVLYAWCVLYHLFICNAAHTILLAHMPAWLLTLCALLCLEGLLPGLSSSSNLQAVGSDLVALVLPTCKSLLISAGMHVHDALVFEELTSCYKAAGVPLLLSSTICCRVVSALCASASKPGWYVAPIMGAAAWGEEITVLHCKPPTQLSTEFVGVVDPLAAMVCRECMHADVCE